MLGEVSTSFPLRDGPKDMLLSILPPRDTLDSMNSFLTYNFKLKMNLTGHKLTVVEDHPHLRRLSLDKMQAYENQEIKQDKDTKPKV